MRGCIAFTAGALSVLAFAPFSYYLLALVGTSLIGLLWLNATPAQAFREGWAFGLGLMGFGVFWLHISIDQFGNIGTPGAIAVTLLFIAAIALFYGVVGWVALRFGGGLSSCLRLSLLFPALWVLGEVLRGWIFTGFPWLAMGYSQIDSPLRGYAPLLGVYGASWVVLLAAGLLLCSLLGVGRHRWVALAGFALLLAIGQGLAQVSWTGSAGKPLNVAMIQANIAQSDKWRKERLEPTLTRYRQLTDGLWDNDLIIWPETAIPAFAHQVKEKLLNPLAQQAIDNQSELLVGIPVWESEQSAYYNAMLQLGHEREAYYKRHLVPFGEFIPLRSWLRPLLQWMQVPMSNFAAGTHSAPTLKVAGYLAGISICYEDAFGEEVIQALPEAAFLINASNDAWFGDSLAPPQHLQIARMRALESGRYLIRSTNTGISALIGPGGEVTARSPAFQEHVLQGQVVPMQGATPYVLFGNSAIVLLCLFILLGLWRYSSHRR